jgi:multiple sugar transport system substrate-binding protein
MHNPVTASRRILRLVVFALFFTGLLVSGCNLQNAVQYKTPEPTSISTPKAGTPAVSTSTTPIPTVTVPVELSKLKGIEIRLIHPWSGGTAIELRKLIGEFNDQNIWGIKVSEMQGGSVSETARAFMESMVTSDRLNLVAIPPEYLASWNAGGYTVDLSTYISNSEWGIPEKEQKTYLPNVWKANTSDSGQLGIPAQINLQFLVYNQTWAKELGFSNPPETQDEFLTQMCEAARKNNQDSNRDNDGTGGWIINSNSSILLSWINAFDGNQDWVNNPRKVISREETGDAYSYLRTLMEKGCAWNSRVASPFTYFATRQTLAFSATLPDLVELEQTLEFGKNTDEWVIIPYPGIKTPSPVLLTGLSYSISRSEGTHELASWLFLRWFTLPRNQARLAEASGSIPPTTTALELMKSYGDQHAWWAQVNKMVSGALVLPASAEWRKVRPVLEDGFWQILQPTPMPIPTLLNQMDNTYDSVPE